MQYDAITIDTNIFRHNGWHLEGGMLGQLAQFKEGSAQFILSEVVIREVHKYLKIEAKEAKDALESAIRKSGRNGLFTPEIVTQLDNSYQMAISPEDAAKNRLQAFAAMTGMIVVPAELTEIKELIKRYFKPAAPFETSGKKKNEFPDAIALLSLEKWAESAGNKILAISDDGGWADFAKDSKWIDVEKDFAAALQKLQQHAEQARILVASLLNDMDSGNRSDLLQKITDSIAEAVGELDVHAEASSAYYVEGDFVTLIYQDFQFVRDNDEYAFEIVQVGKNKIVARFNVSINAMAECDFSFAVWDSIDKEYIPMGTNSVEIEVEFGAAALVTFEGDFSSLSPEVEISGLELIDAIDCVDFGNIEMDYADDHDDDRYDD